MKVTATLPNLATLAAVTAIAVAMTPGVFSAPLIRDDTVTRQSDYANIRSPSQLISEKSLTETTEDIDLFEAARQ
ncbi:hypothetical protein H4R33_003321, partial [Dimargaris cristalligena]